MLTSSAAEELDALGWDTDAGHVPAPSDHAPRTYAFAASGTRYQPSRLVVGEADNADHCMVSGAYLSMDVEHVVEVRQ